MRAKFIFESLTPDKNHGILKSTGEKFWIGVVNVLDGEVEEVHTWEQAEREDFHHSFYFSRPQLEKIESEECMIFWINNNREIEGSWTHGQIPGRIIRSIRNQIDIV